MGCKNNYKKEGTSMKTIKWAIIGTGTIANKFAEALVSLDNTELIAVMSRRIESSLEFGNKFNLPSDFCFNSAEAMLELDNIDIVYIATPNNSHFEYSMLSLHNGKSVLCEKPSMLNQNELEEVATLAKEKNLFFMEAMKNRFMPSIQALKKMIDEGVIGDIKLIETNFGFTLPFDESNYLFYPELGGGALLDVGVYSISFVLYLLGVQTVDVHSHMIKGKTSVDETVSFTIKHGEDVISHHFSSIKLNTDRFARITGTQGFIRIPRFSSSQKLIISTDDTEEVLEFPFELNGMEYQILEANRCLIEGLNESPIMSFKDSLETMRIIELIQLQHE